MNDFSKNVLLESITRVFVHGLWAGAIIYSVDLIYGANVRELRDQAHCIQESIDSIQMQIATQMSERKNGSRNVI